LQHSRFIEKAGSPVERIVINVADLKGTKVNYLSLLLVKNPNRMRGEMQRGCRKKTTIEIEEEIESKVEAEQALHKEIQA
jgi:precorrin-2/cobalt-factor-2 C20-methyltransferase